MLLPVISGYRNSIKKITTQNNIRLISNVPFNEAFTYNYKNNFLIRKLTDVNDWYIKFTGLDEVKRLQDKVITTQERLERVQEERREKGKIIVYVRKDATAIQEQLHQVKKWENIQKFVDLTQEEAELIKKERELTAQFEVLDKEERELFSTLCNTIRDSHEKEKAQSEYTKYWGIILSIIGTIVGAVISTIISTIRNRQIVIGINKNVEEKFNEIANMYKMENLNDTNEKNILFFRNENRVFFKEILKNVSETLNEITNLKNDSNNFRQEIIKVLRQLSKNMNDTNRGKYLVAIDEMKKENVIQFSNQGSQLSTFYLGLVGIGIISLICGCCCR